MSLSTVAKYLSSLVRRCAPCLGLFILRQGQTRIFSSPKNPLQGEPAAREAQLVPQISLWRADYQRDRKKSHSIQSIAGSRWGFLRLEGLWDREHLCLRKTRDGATAEGNKRGMLLGRGRSGQRWKCRPRGTFLAGGGESSAVPQPRSEFVNVINLEVLLLPQVQLTLPSANP